LSTYVQALVSGVLVGGLFGLMAVGFSLTWGLLRFINLAHFALILLGGYITYHIAINTGVDPFLTLLLTVPLFFGVGMVVQWLFDKFKVTVFNSLLITFGLFIIVENMIRNIWGADFLRIPTADNPYGAMSFFVAGTAVRVPRLLGMVAVLVIAIAAAALLHRTYVGKALRALAQDRDMAAAYGIDRQKVSTLLAGAIGASAAIAGTLVAVSGTLFPQLAEQWIGMVFAVVILGGVGSPTGALVAALMVGAATGLATVAWGPSAAPLVAFILLIAVLLWRPYGLFGKAVT
jgi:branched-chain amino acid transport system permease protein